MCREELIYDIKTAYQKGYRDGFTDAGSLMIDTTKDLIQSMEEGLDSEVTINNAILGRWLGGEE